MGYPPIEDLLPKAGYSVYKLVRMASNRAVELADGKPKLLDLPASEKTPTIALEEIRAAKVVLKEVADLFKPKEKDKKERSKHSDEPATQASVS